MPTPLTDSTLIARFADITGGRNALTADADIAPHLVELRGLYKGESPLVLRPGSTQEVSAILRLAHQTNTAVVPQGGNTGLVGGQSPRPGQGEIVLSLARLNKIRSLDTVGQNDGGGGRRRACPGRSRRPATRDCCFPLSLGSEGSCQIGGNLSSNAGGTAVLAYGNMRPALPGSRGGVARTARSGTGCARSKKDNTGYDLRGSVHRRGRHARRDQPLRC